MNTRLLSRDDFREATFARDGHRCVVCKDPAQDAHHILERRLWTDGGYYLDNGASLCGPCHLKAEQTLIDCDDLRAACRITRDRVLVPYQLDRDERYDKWGNPILPDGRRLRGELFDDESVQKVLAPVLHLFTNRVKYPRTYHLPWSGRIASDDRMFGSGEVQEMFEGHQVVVTVKMDGENTTMYRDGIHARAVDGAAQPHQAMVRAIHGAIAHEIPDGWRVCGENLYARHRVAYEHLASYFQVFSIWNDRNECLSWDDTVEWVQLLGLRNYTVPTLHHGIWSEERIRSLREIASWHGDPVEGYVVRVAGSFRYRDFRRSVAKYVRNDFVPTVGGQLVKNRLEEGL